MYSLQSSLPTLDQVEAAKSKTISAFAERLQTPDGVSQIVLDIESYGLGRDYMITFADRINAVTPADVQRAAQNNLRPQSVAVAVAAPASCCEDGLKKLGSVTVLR
jgi:predicted Zn-dependent peptidase